ncbi:hypothetical protein BGX27_004694, partial [Mortierella sp. AM989]
VRQEVEHVSKTLESASITSLRSWRVPPLLGATTSTVPAAASSQESETASATTSSSQDLHSSDAIRSQEVFKNAKTDKFGRKIIEVPVGSETVECALKALCYLWKRQASSDASLPNPASNPRKDVSLSDTIQKYKSNLVFDKPVTGKIRTGTCSTRDPYTEQLFIRMISFTWRSLPIAKLEGVRKYNAANRFPYMREHLSLVARHHMLLRDEDIRNLNLSDTFTVQTQRGPVMATGLVFCFSRGETNQTGKHMWKKSLFQISLMLMAGTASKSLGQPNFPREISMSEI